MTRRHSAALLALLSCAFFTSLSQSAFAHHPGGSGNTGSSGPINTMSASTLAKGAKVLGIVVDYTHLDALSDRQLEDFAARDVANGGDADIHSLGSLTGTSLNFAYGVTNDLTLSVRLPHIYRNNVAEVHPDGPGFDVEHLGDASGLGDLSVLGQWRFINSSSLGLEVSAFAGVKAPTGKTNAKSAEGETFEAEFQPGSGSWDVLAGLAVTRRYQDWSFDISGLYTFASEGTQNTNLGDRFTYGAAVSYRAFGEKPHGHEDGTVDTHGPAVDLVLELNGEWSEKQVIDGEVDRNSGGHVLYLAPGARYTNENFSAFTSVGFPIINDLTGFQAEPDLRLVSGVSVGF